MLCYIIMFFPNVMATQLHACFDVGVLEDLEPKGECWQGDSPNGLQLPLVPVQVGWHWVNQLQQMTRVACLHGEIGEKKGWHGRHLLYTFHGYSCYTALHVFAWVRCMWFIDCSLYCMRQTVAPSLSLLDKVWYWLKCVCTLLCDSLSFNWFYRR